MEVSIQRLKEEDWESYAHLRLKALKSDPRVFGSSYGLESQFTEFEWRARLRDADNSAIFILFDNDRPIGMTGIGVDRNDPEKKRALMWGSWLEPNTRRMGLSGLMYEARIDWARRHPSVEKIIVSHRASNLSSKYANQKHGFVLAGTTEKTWPDGEVEDEVHYVLDLRI